MVTWSRGRRGGCRHVGGVSKSSPPARDGIFWKLLQPSAAAAPTQHQGPRGANEPRLSPSQWPPIDVPSWTPAWFSTEGAGAKPGSAERASNGPAHKKCLFGPSHPRVCVDVLQTQHAIKKARCCGPTRYSKGG